MKIIINTCYGGFGINSEWCAKNCEKTCNEDCRKCEKLIHAIEKKEKTVNNEFSKLTIVEIPDEVTDYKIQNYDGDESLLYVLNGKIKYV